MYTSDNALSSENNPFKEQWPDILAAHQAHFVQPHIQRHLAEELRLLTPEILDQLKQTTEAFNRLSNRYALAYLFLNTKICGDCELDRMTSLMETVSEVLRLHLQKEDGTSLFLDEWTGKTRGNRKQVELSEFIVALANILKKNDGIPWGKVQTAIKLLAEYDPRLQRAACTYISNGECGTRALRSLYNRTVRT